jgi:site-specific recombinase XerD
MRSSPDSVLNTVPRMAVASTFAAGTVEQYQRGPGVFSRSRPAASAETRSATAPELRPADTRLGQVTPDPEYRSPRSTASVAGLGYRVTAHGLRHSFANWLKTAGVPTRDIQEALRHRDQRTTAAYLHTSDGEKPRAINLLPSRQ